MSSLYFKYYLSVNNNESIMTLSDISNLRLINQQIIGTKFRNPRDIVHWMGAMQAQDLGMAKWAVGVRLPDSTEKIIEEAINNAEIIRTHVLRPTWHFVSPDDIYWMLELTRPQIKSAMSSRDKQLGLTKFVYSKCNKVIEKSITLQKQLTSEEIKFELEKTGIDTGSNRLYHLLFRAELEEIICSCNVKGNKQTYALLAERVPNKKIFVKEEALAFLAKRYFSSHSPATIKDFIWWSGLSVTDAKAGLEMIKSGLISETVNSEIYWFHNNSKNIYRSHNSAFLFPPFDEIVISYRDRSAVLPAIQNKNTISSNGIFRPVIVINGKAKGIWKRKIKKDKVIMEFELFDRPSSNKKKSIEKSAQKYGSFLEKKPELIFKSG